VGKMEGRSWIVARQATGSHALDQERGREGA
jgi:hypothetical protein